MRLYIDLSNYESPENKPPTIRYVRSPCANDHPCFWIERDGLFLTMDLEMYQYLVKRGAELIQQGPEDTRVTSTEGAPNA